MHIVFLVLPSIHKSCSKPAYRLLVTLLCLSLFFESLVYSQDFNKALVHFSSQDEFDFSGMEKDTFDDYENFDNLQADQEVDFF